MCPHHDSNGTYTQDAADLTGSIDSTEFGLVIGWAAFAGSAERCVLDLVVDDVVVATCTADLLREDLRSAGIGDGRFGFVLQVPAQHYDGNVHRVRIRERATGSELACADEQVVLLAEARAEVDRRVRRIMGARGAVDSCAADGIVGWARSGHAGNERVILEWLIDGELQGREAATLLRRDIRQSGVSDGRCGFKLRWPASVFDGRPHKLTVQVADGGDDLRGSPATVVFSPMDHWLWSSEEAALQRVALAEQALSYADTLPDEAWDQSHYQTIVALKDWAQTLPARTLVLRANRLLRGVNARSLGIELDGLLEFRHIGGHVTQRWEPPAPLTLQLLEADQVVAELELAAPVKAGAPQDFVFTLPDALLDNKLHRFGLSVKPLDVEFGPWSFLLPNCLADWAAQIVNRPLNQLERARLDWEEVQASQQLERRDDVFGLDFGQADEGLAGSATAGGGSVDIIGGKRDASPLPPAVEDRLVAACRLGAALRAAGNWGEAAETYRIALTFHDGYLPAIEGLVQSLLDGNDVEAAEIVMHNALQRLPDEGALHSLRDDLLGWRRVHTVRNVAFYLPQFHPTQENNAWWGEGFTEWHNVGGAKAMFNGHLQPRRPTSLGYYDLRLPEAANAQFDLARRYGIDGFCYYYYWFEGVRILQKPLDDLVAGRTGPFPFCICWANEDWTRTWDGLSGEVLMAQNHAPDSDFAFIQDVGDLLRHPEYIRVNGRPMLLIYRADKLATPKDTVTRWRAWCRQHGIGEIYLCAVQSFGFYDPRPLGFDAAVEFPPHCPWDRYPELGYLHELRPEGIADGFSGKVYDYQAFARAAMERPREPYTLHRTSMAAWDNTARRGKTASIYHGFTVDTFERWMEANARRTSVEQSDGVCFINAWNEWAEGTVLEPDAHFGYELLEAFRRTKRRLSYGRSLTYWLNGRPLMEPGRLEHREHIVMVGHDAFPSGAQINLLNMVRGLKRQLQMDVTIFLIEGGALLPDYENVASTFVVGRNADWKVELKKKLRGLSRLGIRKAICNTVATGDVAEVLKEEGFTVVGLLHELPSLIEGHGLVPQAWRFADKCDAIVGAAKLVIDEFSQRYWPDAKKLLVAPQGIAFNRHVEHRDELRRSIREELNLPVGCMIVIGCGYADTRKGIDLFVRVAAQVIRCNSPGNVAFVWVGEIDPSIAPYVCADVSQLGLEEMFHLVGRVKDPGRYLIAADVFTLTSREDPFPSVVMEAFDAHLPVVAFDGGGGYVEIVGANTGALVPYLDVEAMSAAVDNLLKDPVVRTRIGDGNHALSRQRFGYVPYLKRLLSLLGGVPAEQMTAGLSIRQAEFDHGARPRISAIVPNYNYARYLELRLATIVGQTLPPDEIIVLDDASSDHSVQVVEAFAKRSPVPIRLVVNERNSGNPFVQWEKGLQTAKGDLVWIAEADDYCEPTLVETLARELRDARVVMAWADSVMVDAHGNGGGGQYKDYFAKEYGAKWRSHFRMNGKTLVDDCLFIENVVPNASAVLFRRDAVRFDFGPVLQYRFSGDWWFWMCLAQQGDIAYRPEPLNYHRRHPRSVMGDVLKSRNRLLAETEAFYRRAVEGTKDLVCTRTRQRALARYEELSAGMSSSEVGAGSCGPISTAVLARKLLPASMTVLSEPSSEVLLVSPDAWVDGVLPEEVTAVAARSSNIFLLGCHKDGAAYRMARQVWPNGLVTAVDTAVSTRSAVKEMSDKLNLDCNVHLVSHGLLAHCIALRLVNLKGYEWTLLAGKDFDALLGRLPAANGVTLDLLSQAVQTATHPRFVGERAPHAFGRIAQGLRIPLEQARARERPILNTHPMTGLPGAVTLICCAPSRGQPIELLTGLLSASQDLGCGICLYVLDNGGQFDLPGHDLAGPVRIERLFLPDGLHTVPVVADYFIQWDDELQPIESRFQHYQFVRVDSNFGRPKWADDLVARLRACSSSDSSSPREPASLVPEAVQ